MANFVAARQEGYTTHMADLASSQNPEQKLDEVFPPEAFTYDANTDTYLCPAG